MMNDPVGLLNAISSIPGVGPYLVYVPVVVLVMNALSTALPAPTSKTGFYNFAYTFVNVLALSLGHAKNAASGEVGGPASLVVAKASVVEPKTDAPK